MMLMQRDITRITSNLAINTGLQDILQLMAISLARIHFIALRPTCTGATHAASEKLFKKLYVLNYSAATLLLRRKFYLFLLR
jgi:hypothetical protein